MFESIIESKGPARHLGKGAVASVVMHAALLGGVLWVSGRSAPQVMEAARTITFFDAPAPPPPPPPPPGGANAMASQERPKKRAQKDKLVKTEKPVEPTPEPVEKAPEPVAETSPAGVTGGVPGGVAGGQVGGVLGGQLGGVLGGTLGGTGKGPPTTQVLPFGAGMQRPTLVSKRDPVYSREARAAHVEGLMLVKCVITQTGSLDNCRVVKSLPHVEKDVLAALKEWRYTPVKYQGRVVSVDYVIPVQLVAP